MATKSKFSDVLSKIAFVIAVLLTLFQSYTALFGVLTAVYQRAIHLGLASSYIFLFNMANPKEKGKVFHIIINFIGLVASAGSNFYICLHYAEIQGRLGITTELDMIFGALLLVAILIMGYESLGWALPTISVIFLLYGLFGHLIPGALSHQAFTFKRLISFLYLGTEGVFGSAMSVSATFIFIFILFGAFLEKSGAGQFFVNLALTATGRVTGGPALAAVASFLYFSNYTTIAPASGAMPGLKAFVAAVFGGHTVDGHLPPPSPGQLNLRFKFPFPGPDLSHQPGPVRSEANKLPIRMGPGTAAAGQIHNGLQQVGLSLGIVSIDHVAAFIKGQLLAVVIPEALQQQSFNPHTARRSAVPGRPPHRRDEASCPAWCIPPR